MRPRAIGLSSAKPIRSSLLLCHHPTIYRPASPILLSHLPQRRWLTTKYIAKVAKANEDWAARARRIEAGEGQYFWDFLEERGLVKDIAGSRDQIRTLFNVKRVGGYVGVDPTADSLHIGHLIAFMPIFHMFLRGYPAFILLGSATAKIGDPTGRLTDREQEDTEVYRNNLFKIHYQIKQLWPNVEALARLYGWKKEWEHKRGIDNNGNWWNRQPMFDILRLLGTDLRMGPLLSRDTVKKKMEEGDGLSFTEFVYPIMQAWDWWTLFTRRGVQVQVGGSDQYGNILTGIECFKIIRKNEPDPNKKISPGLLSDPVGFTVPLLTSPKGEKLGKSAGNAVWLDPFKNPPHDLYAYFLKQSDEKALELLKLLTLMPTKDIEELYEEHMKDPPKRLAHHKLAYNVVWMCHGKQLADQSQLRHITLHGGAPELVEEALLATKVPEAGDPNHVTMNNRPRMDMQLPMSILEKSVGRILQAAGFVETASEGHRVARAGGAYIGGKPGQKPYEKATMPSYQIHWTPIKDWFPEFNENFLIDGKYMYLRKGKNTIRIIELVPDDEYKESGQTYPGQEKTGEFRKLRMALQQAEADLRKKKKQGLDINSDLEMLEESGKETSSVKGGRNTGGITFPANNDRAQRIQGLHGRVIRKIARPPTPAGATYSPSSQQAGLTNNANRDADEEDDDFISAFDVAAGDAWKKVTPPGEMPYAAKPDPRKHAWMGRGSRRKSSRRIVLQKR